MSNQPRSSQGIPQRSTREEALEAALRLPTNINVSAEPGADAEAVVANARIIEAYLDEND